MADILAMKQTMFSAYFNCWDNLLLVPRDIPYPLHCYLVSINLDFHTLFNNSSTQIVFMIYVQFKHFYLFKFLLYIVKCNFDC